MLPSWLLIKIATFNPQHLIQVISNLTIPTQHPLNPLSFPWMLHFLIYLSAMCYTVQRPRPLFPQCHLANNWTSIDEGSLSNPGDAGYPGDVVYPEDAVSVLNNCVQTADGLNELLHHISLRSICRSDSFSRFLEMLFFTSLKEKYYLQSSRWPPPVFLSRVASLVAFLTRQMLWKTACLRWTLKYPGKGMTWMKFNPSLHPYPFSCIQEADLTILKMWAFWRWKRTPNRNHTIAQNWV